MLVCSVVLRPKRFVIAADIVEATVALDANTTGNIVFATLVDAPAAVDEVVDAFLGEVILEAAAALDTLDGTVPGVFTSDIDETASAADTQSVAAAVTGATWNPADKSAGVTLTNSNLTATASGGNQGVRATVGASSGKLYFEMSFTSVQGYIGIGSTSMPFNATTGAVGVAPTSGWLQVNGSSVINIGGLVSPVSVAVDLGVKRIWFRSAPSGNWNGNATYNPATNVGGVDISALSGPLYPMTTVLLVGNNPTANFGGSAFVGTVPSGFTAWPSS